VAAFGEVHEPTWVFSKEPSLGPTNSKDVMRNGEPRRWECHRISAEFDPTKDGLLFTNTRTVLQIATTD
jgi:hypothetical protein